jgi:hypothetical protein
LQSSIERLLQDQVAAPDGLQFIVFIPDSRFEKAFSGAQPQAANHQSIGTLIQLHGLHTLGHTPERQVEIWQRGIGPVRNFFNKLQNLDALEPGGAPSSLTRVVLDVEVGGIFCAAVGNFGWVFAATLDQQPLNTGAAERHFAGAVKKLHAALKRLGSEGSA